MRLIFVGCHDPQKYFNTKHFTHKKFDTKMFSNYSTCTYYYTHIHIMSNEKLLKQITGCLGVPQEAQKQIVDVQRNAFTSLVLLFFIETNLCKCRGQQENN